MGEKEDNKPLDISRGNSESLKRKRSEVILAKQVSPGLAGKPVRPVFAKNR